MECEDKLVIKFDLQRFMKITKFPVICIYNSPSDYPNKYVARLWDIDKPTSFVAIAESLEEIREIKPTEMIIIQRQPNEPNDGLTLVETWVQGRAIR